MSKKFIIIILALISITFNKIAIASPSIEWKLENSFRMFLDPQNTKVHQEEYEKLSQEEMEAPILNIERRLSEKYPYGWAKEMYKATCWDNKKQRYNNCKGKKKDYLHPKSHIIIASLKNSNVTNEKCTWKLYVGKTKIHSQKTSNCSDEIKIEVPYPSGGNLKVEQSGKLITSKRIKVTDLFIVGLGDSFGSGEGNPDKPVVFSEKRSADYGRAKKKVKLKHYPTRVGRWLWVGDSFFNKRRARWQSRSCHRSLYSHQLRVALQLALESKQRAVTFAGFACSGAEAIIGLLDRYKGNEWVKYTPDTSQIGAAARAACGPNPPEYRTYTTTFTYGNKLPELENLGLYHCNKKKRHHRNIDLVLLSIGGNDVGFSRLVANAILSDASALKQLGGWMGQIYKPKHAERRLEQLKLRYKALKRALHIILHVPWNQADRVILTAYPKMGYMQDGKTICPDGAKGMDLHPIFKTNSKRVRAGEVFAKKLNEVMKSKAKQNKWTFVDEHREAFAKHGFCAYDEQNKDKLEELFGIPKKNGEGWKLYNPADYRPYASRQRWIRTPNDVYMGTHQHTKRQLIRKFWRTKNLNQFQLIYAGTYGGSFHPTAEGHAVIADAILKKARRILRKYK